MAVEMKIPKGKEHKRPGKLDQNQEEKNEDGSHNEDFDHEAVTGSHKDAEEFKELSPEESKRRLGVLLPRMDINKDNVIDKNELTQWIITSFKKLDKEDAAGKLEEHDENDDKKITWAEYLLKAYGYKEKELSEFEKDKSDDMKNFVKMLHEDKAKFTLADVNKDGSLDLEEYTAFTHPHNYMHMAPTEVKRSMEDYDKNKDGFIDMNEFISDITKGKDGSKPDASFRKSEEEHFQSYDTNKDGKLDATEITKWVMPGFTESAGQEADHLMKESDKNKDKKLTVQEILDQYELWVGSQATDYGKHLDEMKKDEL